MIEGLLSEEGMEAVFTRAWRIGYGRLFRPAVGSEETGRMRGAGPDAPPASGAQTDPATGSEEPDKPLTFHFAPEMGPLIRPDVPSLPTGTDTWALHNGYASVTPLRAAFAEPDDEALTLERASGGDRGAGTRLRL